MRFWKVAVFCGVLLLCCSLFAQNVNTGDISGTVKDSSGAAVPGASISIVNTDTGVTVRQVTSDNNGLYSALQVPVGHYKLTAEKNGFKTVTLTSVELNTSSKLTEDFALRVGQASESVTVEADAAQVELQTATASGLINGTQIVELSLNNRNYEQLVQLQPGVSYGGGDQLYVGTTNPSGQTNTVQFSINGSRNSANNWTIDGADNVDRGSNQTLLNYPSVDAIAEFKTLRGEYNAEFGRSASGQINVITKSGTNHFHGGAYEFFRNDVLNANEVTSKQVTPNLPRKPLRYNDFGGTFGGPIPVPHLKDNTFFFISEEIRRVITYANQTSVIPTAAELTGVFPKAVCIAANFATGACTTRSTNVGAINPVAAAYIKDIFSKLPPVNSGTNSLLSSFRNIFNYQQELARLDHNFGTKVNVFYRFINDHIPTKEPGGLFTGAVLPGVADTSTNSPGRSHLGHVQVALSPSLLVDGGYSFSYGAIVSNPTGLINSANSPDINVARVFPTTLTRIPAVTFTGGSSITSFGPYRDFNRDHNVFGNLTKTWGRHNLKFGGTYHHYQKTENAGGNNAGTFGFTTTGIPTAAQVGAANVPTTFEQSFAWFLLGTATNSYTQDSLDLTPDIQTHQFEVYGQDEWRMLPNLTISIGARYSRFNQPMDANNFLSNFSPAAYDPAKAPTIDTNGLICTAGAPCTGTAPNPAANPLNGIIVNTQNLAGGIASPFGKAVGRTSNGDIAPRLGFSWDPWKDGKTAVRGGYGYAYDATLFGVYEQNIFGNLPFVQSIAVPFAPFANPGSSAATVSFAPRNLHGTPDRFQDPYTQQWSLDVQREMARNLIMDIGYFGSKGTNLMGILDINQPLPGAFVTGTGGRTGQALNIIRPFRGYGVINSLETVFDSNYSSMQFALQKRFAGKSQIQANYTWSHCLTDNQTDRSTAAQNTYNVAGEYGPCQFDRRHIFNLNAIYELPFYRAQQGLVGHVLGGWELSGIAVANSGLPLTVTSSGVDPAGQGNNLAASAAGARPDQIGDPNSGANHTVAQWFNTAAFAQVPAGQARPGTERRGAVTGPGFWRMDTSLFKNINIREDFRLQFRAEAFNVLNHANPNTIGTASTTAATFGRITAYRDPRIMQLALKLYF